MSYSNLAFVSETWKKVMDILLGNVTQIQGLDISVKYPSVQHCMCANCLSNTWPPEVHAVNA